jgi:hypothetical protein
MAFTLEKGIIVASTCARDSVHFKDDELQYIEGKMFVHASCKNKKLTRVLSSKSASFVFERLRTMRNMKFIEYFKADSCNLEAPQVCVDESSIEQRGGKRFSTPSAKRKLHAIPEIVVIDAAPGFQMHVVCSKPGSELWVELTVENLAYLKSSIDSPSEGAVVEATKEPRDEKLNEGIFVDKSKKSYVVPYISTDGSKRRMYFKFGVDKDEAVQQANDFQQSILAPPPDES